MKLTRTIVGTTLLAATGGGLAGYSLHQPTTPPPAVVQAAPQPTIECDQFSEMGIVSCVDGNTGTVYATYRIPVDVRPACQEDEVLAVKVDANPAHALTWECVNAQAYIVEALDPKAQAFVDAAKKDRSIKDPYSAGIGNNTVPDGLHCQEDEVIGYVVTDTPPYQLGCVHNEGGVLG